MSVAERFLAAFVGSEVAHGTAVVLRTNRNGKAETDNRTVRAPLDKEKVQRHLRGELGVGSIPIKNDSTCHWGALDIDDYDLDHKSLQNDIQKLKLPLLHCRSKSGGAHLFLFLEEPLDAAVLREYLTEIKIALGFSSAEIFPKQEKILADRGDSGNPINLPYYNCEITTRYCFNKKHEAMEIEEFLDAIDSNRIKESELEGLKFSGKRKYFTDGPPCLEHIFSHGPVGENRNQCLTQIGIYTRKKFGDDWEPELEKQNRKMFSPPLEAKEMLTVQKSVGRKDYRYLCQQEPFKSFCDPELCAMRNHGIGSEAETMPQVGGLTIMLSEPRLYFMNVNGKRIQLFTEQLQNPMLWQRACMEQANEMPPKIKTKKWDQLVHALMRDAIKMEVPPELTISGQFQELLKTFCTGRVRAMVPEELELGKPWTEDGKTYFKMEGLLEFLKNRRFEHYTGVQIQEQLRRINGHDKCNGHHAIRKSDDTRTTVRVWWVPEFEETEVKLKPQEFKRDDIPF